MVMMFVGGVVLLFDEISVLFLQKEIYDAGVFHSRLNPYRGKAVNEETMDLGECLGLLVICALTNERPAYLQLLVHNGRL